MQKKDDKVGNNTGYKKERQREKKKDRVRVKTKELLHYILLVGKYGLVVIPMLIGRKPVQKRGIGEQCGFFFATLWHSPKG